ncbi:MAG: hypothetical protein A2Z64_14795 [Betaproteobacteria bacterium RIFCSPLOWO2_02_67_12]|nr:MAG: hypothetical protein A2Z64_14795 [Betaproteobacteria bacterium RIFCSPLOWO2_02_67_12]
MNARTDDLFRELLARQGVALAPERLEALARALGAQLEAERAATRALAFEVEPASFTRVLEGSAR